jgi:hypothetical protein
VKKLQIFECSIEGCSRKTTRIRHFNPRLRWIIGLRLKDHDTGQELTVNFCPSCTRKYVPGCDEQFFSSLEKTEAMIAGTQAKVIH